eukprot:scaffold178_cov255-Pinguiococcus_pyrenoidosus.AAC.13
MSKALKAYASFLLRFPRRMTDRQQMNSLMLICPSPLMSKAPKACRAAFSSVTPSAPLEDLPHAVHLEAAEVDAVPILQQLAHLDQRLLVLGHAGSGGAVEGRRSRELRRRAGPERFAFLATRAAAVVSANAAVEVVFPFLLCRGSGVKGMRTARRIERHLADAAFVALDAAGFYGSWRNYFVGVLGFLIVEGEGRAALVER